MSDRSVITTSGKLYKIGEYAGVYYVKRNGTDLGKARRLDDALALIRSHSGEGIKEID